MFYFRYVSLGLEKYLPLGSDIICACGVDYDV